MPLFLFRDKNPLVLFKHKYWSTNRREFNVWVQHDKQDVKDIEAQHFVRLPQKTKLLLRNGVLENLVSITSRQLISTVYFSLFSFGSLF